MKNWKKNKTIFLLLLFLIAFFSVFNISPIGAETITAPSVINGETAYERLQRIQEALQNSGASAGSGGSEAVSRCMYNEGSWNTSTNNCNCPANCTVAGGTCVRGSTGGLTGDGTPGSCRDKTPTPTPKTSPTTGSNNTPVPEPSGGGQACNRNRVANDPNACCGSGGSHNAGCSGRSECGSHVYKYASGCGGYCGAQVDVECVKSERNRQTYPNDRWGTGSHTYWRGQFGPKSFYESCSSDCPKISCCVEYTECCCSSHECGCSSDWGCSSCCDYYGRCCCVRWEYPTPCSSPSNWKSGYQYNCDEPQTCAERSDTTYSADPGKFKFDGTDIGQISPTCSGTKLAKYSTWTDGWCDTCYDCTDKMCNTKIDIKTTGSPVGCSTQKGLENYFRVEVDNGTSSGDIRYNGSGNFSFSYNGIGEKNKVTFKVVPTITYGTIEPEFTMQDGVCTARWWADSNHDFGDSYGLAEQNGRWQLIGFEGKGALLGQDLVQDGSCTWDGCKITCQIDVYNEGGFITTACGTSHTLELDLKLRFVPDLRTVTAYDGPGDAIYIPENPIGGVYALTGTCLDYPAGIANNLLSGLSDNLLEHQTVVRAKDTYNSYFYNVPQNSYITLPIFGYRSKKVGISPITEGEKYIEMQLYGVEALKVNSEITTVLDQAKTNRGYWSCACPTAIAIDEQANSLTCGYQIYPETEAQACVTKRTYVSFVPCTNAPWFQASGGNIYGYAGVSDNVPLNSTEGCGGDDNCLDNSQNNNTTNWFTKNVTTNNPNYYKYQENFKSSGKSTGTSYSCTPRIIRGRTPCKTDGESASAGIVLTHEQTDNIQANTKNRSKFALSYTENDLKNLALRVTERATQFALNQTAYDDQNESSKTGMIQPAAASRSGAFTNTAQTYSRPGFTPRREGWEYFVTLANTYGFNEQVSRFTDRTYTTTNIEKNGLTDLSNWCYEVPEEEDPDRNQPHGNYQGYINYICYVGSDLNITDGTKWHLDGYYEDSAANLKYQRKITIFVNGNLIVGTPNYYKNYEDVTQGRTTDSLSDNGLVLVDVGNFLAFIVNKDIVVQANAGINMPPPDVDNDRVATICWEGQNAAIPGQNNPTTNVADSLGFAAPMYRPDQPATTGVMEGIYIAEGALRIRSSHFTYNNDNTQDSNGTITTTFGNHQPSNEAGSYKCKITRADKRFIGHGSFITWGGTIFDRNFDYYTDNYIARCQDYIKELDKQQGNGGIDPIGLVEASYNNRAPVDSFIYRADLVRNTPAWMKATLLNIVEW